MKKDILYLGSQSKPRQDLIKLAGIEYKVLKHNSDECVVETGLSFSDYVLSIAKHKMEMLELPDTKDFKDGDYIFVLTSDTLVRSVNTKQVLTKPDDLADAKRMIGVLRQEPAEVVTGCCIEKKVLKNNSWDIEKQNCWVNDTVVEFCVPEDMVDLFLQREPNALRASGSAIIENYGQNFLKSVNGSYTSVMGLPLFEVRQALRDMGFE